jgi:hypothetical protein
MSAISAAGSAVASLVQQHRAAPPPPPPPPSDSDADDVSTASATQPKSGQGSSVNLLA